MLPQTVISALAPEISVSSQILVLGSMPGQLRKKKLNITRIRRICFGIVLKERFRLTKTRRIKRGWRR